MFKFLRTSSTWALSVITVVFTFIPETIFEKYKFITSASDEANVIIARVLAFFSVLVLSMIINGLFFHFRRSIRIKGRNYNILIKYGNIIKERAGKKVIPFDECFTTNVGSSPSDINPGSVCGQYLNVNPINDVEMQALIDNAQISPMESKSKYQHKVRYSSGTLVANGDDLLLAFAMLNEDGLGEFPSYDEYLASLSMLWKEIDKHYGQKDVCIPILGSGVTRIGDTSLTQQELLDIIIGSYKLSTCKIKSPYKLYIVCKKRDDFSINKIGEGM